MNKSLIIVGEPSRGYDFIGPFDGPYSALTYAEKHFQGSTWHIAPMRAPITEKDAANEQKGQ